MKIYTKNGDDGLTFVPSEGRVNKYDCSVDAQGEIDELNSWIGMIFQAVTTQDVFLCNLYQVQNDLMDIGAQLATNQQRLAEKRIKDLENGIDRMNENLEDLSNFILPRWPAQVHVARSVCRRAERCVAAWRDKYPENQRDKFNLVIPYLNRLSDYLFTLARHISKNDKIWNEK
jgi:cob(I)alamin adenosyltransferase